MISICARIATRLELLCIYVSSSMTMIRSAIYQYCFSVNTGPGMVIYDWLSNFCLDVLERTKMDFFYQVLCLQVKHQRTRLYEQSIDNGNRQSLSCDLSFRIYDSMCLICATVLPNNAFKKNK